MQPVFGGKISSQPSVTKVDNLAVRATFSVHEVTIDTDPSVVVICDVTLNHPRLTILRELMQTWIYSVHASVRLSVCPTDTDNRIQRTYDCLNANVIDRKHIHNRSSVPYDK